MSNVIQYGFGREYLKNWGLKEALREVYQNFLDFGTYHEDVKRVQTRQGVILNVTLFNLYKPETLKFLKIGASDKGDNLNAIGKHGEGLKMAAMIFNRNDLYFEIQAASNLVLPTFMEFEHLGECFAFTYEPVKDIGVFQVSFDIEERLFEDFKSGILQADNHKVIFQHEEYGQLIDRAAGQIYVGGVYVCTVNGFKNSFNLLPRHVHLDRDRSMPRAFDVNWSTGQILGEYGRVKDYQATDLNYREYEYVTHIPKTVVEQITPKIVGNNIQFVTKTAEGVDVVITNDNAVNKLKEHSFFSKVLRKLREVIFKTLGVYELMEQFREKYVAGRGAEMEQEFDIIMQKYTNEKDQ